MLTNINKRVNLNFVAKDPNFLNAECQIRSFVNMEVCPFGSTFQRIMIDFKLKFLTVNQCKRYDYVDINYFIGLKFQRNDVDIMVFDYLKCYVDIINSFKTSI